MSLTCFVQQHVGQKRECSRLSELLASTESLYRFPWLVNDCQAKCVAVLMSCSTVPRYKYDVFSL